MSVEKFIPKFHTEPVPFTQLSTDVIKNIKNLEAGFLWVFLSSFSSDWTIIKAHIKAHFGIGDKKIRTLFSYLHKSGLLEYVQERSSDGKMMQGDIRILNGSRFINIEENKTGEARIAPAVKTGEAKNGSAANRTGGKDTTTKYRNILNKEKALNREKPERKKRVPLSALFKPNQENQALLEETARKSGISKERLLTKFRELAKSKDKLSFDWQSELVLFLLNEKPEFTFSAKNSSTNQVKSTVLEWGPGHPGWESLHGKRKESNLSQH